MEECGILSVMTVMVMEDFDIKKKLKRIQDYSVYELQIKYRLTSRHISRMFRMSYY